MNDLAIRLTVMLNQLANLLGRWLLAPLEQLPELAGAVLVAMVTGILMLIAFKYTSHQAAIKQARDRIKAELLALSLFRDNVAVNLGSQGRILGYALKLMGLALVPIAVMIVPVTLLLGQLSLWWQARPFQVGEDAVVTIRLNGDPKSSWPKVNLEPLPSMEITQGPYTIRSKREICWSIRFREPGHQQLDIHVDGQSWKKDLAVGRAPMRISLQRPEWNWSDIVMHPAEPPIEARSAVKSIDIQYPENRAWATGTHSWLIFWFLGSTIVAFCFRGVFNVNL
ncbi:hypothetical protein [Schlesneria paludicola]|uniref:hypothetical protein n=1 Tax=Schlesneria paludicola TaxID=360056 RepID=UPI00029A853E|nr:hypothetical protein [Schlesneria paludicola]